MNLSYQHANPYSGCESILLRIEGLLPTQTVCILIDSGDDVDIDGLLGDDEYLTAVCLTHAHYDHYRSLARNLRDGAPVYMTPETEQLLDASYRVGKHPSDGDYESILSAVRPINGWTMIVEGLRVRALPAGHAPGAASLLFAIDDGEETRTVLATGDFTLRRAAEYPGFEPDLPLDIDVCLLSAASSEDFETAATDVIQTTYKRANAGSTVLVTAGGQMGLHLGYLFSHFATEQEVDLPVTLVGQTAILADRLEYDLPGVSVVPEFNDASSVLNAGRVTIAGPDVPTADSETSAARLFDQIKNDAAATLIQIPAGSGPPIETAQCTVHSFSLQNHPNHDTIDSVVKSLAPIHLIILHEDGPEADQYKDRYSSYVWVTGDKFRHTLLNDSGWTPPPWVSNRVERYVSQNRISARQPISNDLLTDGDGSEFAQIKRCQTPDLAKEGINTQSIPALSNRVDTDNGDSKKYHVGNSDTVVESSPETGSSAAVRERLAAMNDRLIELERTINQQLPRQKRRSARVLDVHDGVTILRLDEEIPGVEPGDSVEIHPPS